MRSLIVAGLAVSLAAFTVATPALANPPDLMLKPGNAPAAGASSAYGGGFRGGQGGGVRNFGGGGGGRHFGGGYGGGGYGGGGYGGGGYRRHHGYGGAAVGAGIAGLAAGALIGGAIANQQPAYGYGDGYDYGYAAPAPVYVDPGPVYSEGDVVDEVAPVSGDQTAYCEGRYRSYDPRSGTYLGFDGARHPCP